MKEKTIKMDSVSYHFFIENNQWKLELAKSQTRVKDIRELALMKENTDQFVPVEVEDGEEVLTFQFQVDSNMNHWETIQSLGRSDKLRLLCNLARFRKILDTRITFFLHPHNLIFDDNLIPFLVYRGIRQVLPPYEINDETFLLQYKCLSIALFSKKYNFDELYAGSWKNAKDTEFERQISEIDHFDDFVEFLHNQYRKEKRETEKNMQIVPKKRFQLFKRLSIAMIAAAVILAVPVVYFGFFKLPFQQHLLEAHRAFLSKDYSEVISDLESVNPEKLPDSGKYILAYSYVKSENLGDEEKDTIMNNISLKSDPNYLLYWIYNGRGDLDKSLDLAMYLDDPVLIMYSYIKKIEKAKNDPNLSGTERQNQVQQYEEKLKSYGEKYGLESLFVTDPEKANPTEETGGSAPAAAEQQVTDQAKGTQTDRTEKKVPDQNQTEETK